MGGFPYFEILKKAYDLTRENLWLWLFGFFLFGLGKAAVIWAALKFSGKTEAGKPEPIYFPTALRAGKSFGWRILALHLFISVIGGALLAVLSLPIGYLYLVGESGKASMLVILGLLIFLPALMVFAFLCIYGPIFIVVYRVTVRSAVYLAFNLFRHKARESLSLFIFIGSFSIILFSVPLAFLALVLIKSGPGTILFATCVILILASRFSVFQNIAWTLAVLEMVKTEKTEEKAEAAAPAVEAEPAN